MVKKRIDSYILILKILTHKKIKFFQILLLSAVSAVTSGLSIGLIIPILGGNDRQIFENTFFKFLDDFINYQFSTDFNEKIIAITLLIIILSVLELLFSIIIVKIATKYEVDTVTQYLYKVFNKINTTEYKKFYQYNSGEIFTIITVDIFNFSNLIRRGLLVLQPAILLSIFITVMFSVSPLLTLISVIFFIFVSIIIAGFLGRKAKLVNADISLEFVKNNSKLSIFLENFKNLRSMGLEKEETKNLIDSYKQFVNNRRIYANFISYSIPVNNFINIFAIAFLLLSSTYIFRRQPTSWTILLIPFLVLLFKLLPTVNSINQYRVLVESMYPFVVRLDKFVNEKSEINDGDKDFVFKEKIIFDNVSFGYEKNKILNNVNFEISKGDVVGIIGETGAGKSTLIDLMLKIFNKDSGNIFIDKTEIDEIKSESIQNSVAFLPQNLYMSNDTIEKNLNLYNDKVDKKNILNLSSFYDENNKQNHIGQGGINLSGGQKQKINIIRTLTKDSELLILDEPTNNLDPESIQEMSKIIKDSNSTFLVISHNQQFINLISNKIYHLKNGELNKVK
tara:strand:+ start:1788 stop:3482 length:1695 start_codon:yes stop_codon:yes gene_type:complete